MNPIGRRRFNAILAALNLAPAALARRESAEEGPENPEVLHLSRNGGVPNNEHLPVLIYRAVIDPGSARELFLPAAARW